MPMKDHYHCCPMCAHIWWHDPAKFEEGIYAQEHTCEKCGAGNIIVAFFTYRDALDQVKFVRERER